MAAVRRYLVGTAGHIDHGKTALVKALTGIDADRLPEEKRRGITIDLGFAHAEWEGVRISFVDVPGHERFVKNMLAGAGGIDAALLVVAANESVMPQTREHFEIVRLLGLRRGIVAVTKTDRVSPDLVAVTVSDVADLVRGSFLENAPVVAVSAKTGDGLENLKSALVALASEDENALREARGVRLPIDRAFLVPGFGPVVTGSLVSGSISRDQKLELLPRRLPVRVRRVEVHGREEAVAHAGERVSLNLAGVELEDLKRGLTLASPQAFAVTSLVTARVELLAGARLKAGDKVSFHHYSAETRATVGLPESRELLPGASPPSRRVQLRLSSPVAAAPFDRFVLRRLSPVETIGGGVILDPLAPRLLYRAAAENRAVLDVLETGSLPQRLVLWIEQGRWRGADEETLARRAGVTPAEVRAALAGPAEAGAVHVLRRSPERYVGEAELTRLAARAGREMAALLAEASGAVGVPRRTLLERLLPGADARWAEAVEAALVERGVLTVAGDEARPPGRLDLAGTQRELSERIADAFRRRGLAPPSPGDVSIEVNHRPKVVLGLIGYLVKKGALVRLPGGWIIAREAVDDVIDRLRASGRPSIDVGEFKEMFGLTRKLAIPLLEHLDASKVTRRVGDSREILR
jgi:selenocysteine-specific elongation factor